MTYVYVLESVCEPNHRYVGITPDLRTRFAGHNAGRSRYTRKHKPWNLVAYTAFADEQRALRYEKYLKTGSGRAFLSRHFFGDLKASAPYDPPPPPSTFDPDLFLTKLRPPHDS